jgi:hypothetical protein
MVGGNRRSGWDGYLVYVYVERGPKHKEYVGRHNMLKFILVSMM